MAMENHSGSLAALSEELIKHWYNDGNVSGIGEILQDFSVAFGPKQCNYIIGRENILGFLRSEYERLCPCEVYKTHSRTTETLGGYTVNMHVVLKGFQYTDLQLYRVIFMYEDIDGEHGLKGIHIAQDLQHEGTYRSIRNQLIRSNLQDDINVARTTGIVSEGVDFCSVIYSLADEAHPFLSYGDKLWKLLGYDSDADFLQCTQGQFKNITNPADWAIVNMEYIEQISRGDAFQLEYRVKCKDGNYLWVLECGQRTLDSVGLNQSRSVIIDVTALKQANDDLQRRASFDDLTEVYNKRTFYKKSREMMLDNPGLEFRILRLNVERFKVINDLFGEDVGDGLLKHIGNFLNSIQLEHCVCGRLYSDNFVLCFSADDSTTNKLINSLKIIAGSFRLNHNTVLSFGLYRVDDMNVPVSVMCDRANLALNEAKGNYNTPYREYDAAMGKQVVLEQSILNALDKALDEREFLVYFQPKYETINEELIGAEALIRWNHKEKDKEGNVVYRFISPGDFVPVFEKNGLIYNLDKYIWEETCRYIRRWLDEGRDVKPISVNVSRVDLYDPNLVDVLVRLRDFYDVPAELLELELTESAYTDDPLQIIGVTNQLQQKGFVILMDDFGSGYSSLNMLKDVHVDVLKLDMGFLNSSDESGRGGNILNAVVGMAKSLNLQIIAEGVETRDQVEFLKSIGCTWVQGYYYSRPVPSVEYEKRMSMVGGR